jgi:4-hydroxybenzoate polyprenyltransferase
MNDLADIESDREHPAKKERPLPSGQLDPRVAGAASVVLAAFSLVAGYFITPALALILLAYLVVQIAYTFWLKHIVLLDVMVIASGFILRIAAGVVVIDVERFSPWLYVFGGFLALFMALGKRRHELVLLGGDAANHRAILDDYTIALVDSLQFVVMTTAVVAYSLYTFLAEGVPENHVMMLTIPFVVYGIFRYLYLIQVREEGGAPEEILLRDRPLQVDLVLYGIVAIAALYVLN